MNNIYEQELIKQAQLAGIPQNKMAAILQKATAITKKANKINIIDNLIRDAGLQKTASSVSYVNGILNEAFTNGANIPQAINFTKKALDATNKKVAFMEKVSAISNNPQLNQYAEGFMTAAKTAGLSEDESVSLLVDLVDREKTAGGEDAQMFKQSPDSAGGPPPGMMPPGDPSAGGPPPGDPSGGQGGPGASDPQEAQILQMLQSLPPEEQQQIIQQLLAAISGGGQGDPSAGAGGPPGQPGMPPPAMAGPGGQPPPQPGA